MSAFRLKNVGSIDRSCPIEFSFNGKRLLGFRGDTLASALLANGVDIVGRSFKYHRPRGILAAGLDEPNAIVQLEAGAHAIPNLKATAVELYQGLAARSVNSWPSLEFDLLAVNSMFSRFLPAGFYYKTFKWPDWHLYEPAIRRAAGLGASPSEGDADVYDKRFAECDVLVVGGGPAGLSAARVAIENGARTILCELDAEWGGSLLNRDSQLASRWVEDQLLELSNHPSMTLLNRTMAFGYYDHNLIGLVERLTDHLPIVGRTGPRQRLWKVRARHVILANGTFERPLVFPNNDRPGVMLASAALTYAHRYGVAPGRRIVMATNNDGTYEDALQLKSIGVGVVALLDARDKPPSNLAARVNGAGIEVITGVAPTEIKGRRRVTGMELHCIDKTGKAQQGTKRVIECDCVLVSGGWSPAVHLHSQSGGKLAFDESTQAFQASAAVQPVTTIGAAAGVLNLDLAIRDATERTKVIVAKLQTGADAPISSSPAPSRLGNEEVEIQPLWQVDTDGLMRRRGKAWLDFQNDVTADDVQLALRENFRSVEHVKRYTTLGMATDQGKTSNVNGIGVMHKALSIPLGEVGTTKFRPPYDPVTIGAFAGRRVGENLMPLRSLPAAKRHEALGGKMEDYGGWSRAASYPRCAESEHDAVHREVLATRTNIGLFDASPLGKIEVIGPDAAEFLNRIYVNTMKTLRPGRCRYGLMLSEHGIVFDDGLLACIGEGHFLVGTTSGHAATIAETLQEWLQCEWPELEVATQDVTTAWAVMNVNGPRARDLLMKFDTDIGLAAEAFPHMHFRAGEISGTPCRIQRVSFSGELSYEVSVPWGFGAALFDALMTEGEELGITPIGVETLMTMRIEKGFLHVGSDTDGMTMPQDVGFGGILDKKKDDFIGRRSTMQPVGLSADRRQLVGLEVSDGGITLPVGSHVIALNATPPTRTQGYVTSSVYSPTLSRPIALALIERGKTRIGDEVQVWDMGRSRRARIVQPGVYDPAGEKVNA